MSSALASDDAGSGGLSAFDEGFLVGILVGEGHFGGDGRQPQITLRMHTDHSAVFEWLMEHFPESRLYGPYDHAGRRYYQWMARSAFLRDTVVPILDRRFRPEHSGRAWARYQEMKRRYGLAAFAVPDRRSDPDPRERARPAAILPGGAERAAGRAAQPDRPGTQGGTAT